MVAINKKSLNLSYQRFRNINTYAEGGLLSGYFTTFSLRGVLLEITKLKSKKKLNGSYEKIIKEGVQKGTP